MKTVDLLKKQIKWLIITFMVVLAISGITASFLETELLWIKKLLPGGGLIGYWLHKTSTAIVVSNEQYPFLAYGYDWLAFGHVIIALFFWGPLKDPVKNRWIIQIGMIACLAIFPVALIAGHFRQIPFFWQLIDCAFGVFGLALLFFIHTRIDQLQKHPHYV